MPPNPVYIKKITHTDVINALHDLSETMRATDNKAGPADAGMTFFGQFVDHDITLDATSALGTRIDPATIPNVRTPSLDLDCVYGAGPEATPVLYGKDEQEHFLVFGRHANPLDLARTCAGKALIGDPRNDENVIVAQIQGLFIQLHNILMSMALEGGVAADDIKTCAQDGIAKKVWHDHVNPALTNFEEVRRFIRLHYQWIVWNELLPAFVDQTCLDSAINGDLFDWDAPVMPVEFSGACYRFGHATVQFEYKLQSDQEAKGLFATVGFAPRPKDANIDMGLFFEMTGGLQAQKARPVGLGLGSALLDLPFVHNPIELADIEVTLTLAQSRNLALRNMVRDRYTYQLASGQQAAALFGTALVDVPEPLAALGFKKTPLWYYALQEAEEHGNGKLTGAGGNIVAGVFANLLKRDPTTYVHIPHFQTWSGFGGQSSCIAGIAAFVEDHRDMIASPEKLMCG
ncbi:peroxidase family protein [Phaeobacter marinintestinus]|uniref:peroxidase family protein n=1 Tax=Falsiphaeobacter marinintestinus TaxID=1492905 RepID=UPI001647617C|nr:peroxidase family protein [Phaeobacter marinintestinus]